MDESTVVLDKPDTPDTSHPSAVSSDGESPHALGKLTLTRQEHPHGDLPHAGNEQEEIGEKVEAIEAEKEIDAAVADLLEGKDKPEEPDLENVILNFLYISQGKSREIGLTGAEVDTKDRIFREVCALHKWEPDSEPALAWRARLDSLVNRAVWETASQGNTEILSERFTKLHDDNTQTFEEAVTRLRGKGFDVVIDGRTRIPRLVAPEELPGPDAAVVAESEENIAIEALALRSAKETVDSLEQSDTRH